MIPRIGPAKMTTRKDAVDQAAGFPSSLAADDTLRKPGHRIKARAVRMPSDSVLAPFYVGADLIDAYAIQLPIQADDNIEVLARAGFERQAWWIRALTRVRDVVMATVGVKTSRAVGVAAAAQGPVIGFFPLLSKSAEELVMGADDRHLDFRLAILLRAAGAAGDRELVVVTVVHCHNWLGRTYLAVIAPFHRVIAPASLEQAARSITG
ncbi:hypothetical protein QFZ34_001042 [Phyllobacterium ifriqiyense]|uniref:DUF2867 domain-containing protein n=1 Tax=Phyllobacterium ifriqiyense TaxID=314238 RepID=A0ABU0S531_9HYPH|nr:DUF2867 domain-containing protein [Phyllobacterium ifriqiyense]MDQ0995865.1 hypothetical protein [Phyllobacterium ifriqiyense]